ncbi:hypothetical protein CL1_0876 [Thermococcus cleftensis]|uniref:Uncharacterized protein n=1 Tax=Thermococcus cleftensis (strain DSM 27260 / KACC 17922 / CL1) TaxID=163003 RepID=I3ZTP7_THECF|nr:halocin C8-like domain-containing protein [Thermococcus cleftensis]AFL95081.1 hypothetical protein CL1_0876 [Thermococcus cleftensis]
MNWKKTVFGLVLMTMVLSLQLIAAPQAMAMSTNNASITFRRAVVAWYDDEGKLQMNVTWINKVVNFTNITNDCPYRNSNMTPNVNVSAVTLYNMSKKHEQLLFLRLNFYNSTLNYTLYALVYKAERSQYNFTLITRIFTDPKTGEYKAFVTGMNIAPKDEKKSLPIGDVILTASNLTLSQYYWTLNKVLMKLRRGDETNWIWGRSAYELRHLSHLVKLKLPQYDQQKAVGMAMTMDGLKCTICQALVFLICVGGVGEALGCTVYCAGVCAEFGYAAFICVGICLPLCDGVLGLIQIYGCDKGSGLICEYAGAC